MNKKATKEKLESYYQNTTPEQVVKEFEALGVEFVKDECWCYRKLKKCKMYMDCLQMNTKTPNNDTTV